MITDLYLRLREILRQNLTGRSQSGQGLIEYAFILILVAMVLIISVQLLGKRTENLYSNISSGLGT